MPEMPYHLRTLPLEALGLLRFFGASPDTTFTADDLMEITGLSERGFGKALRGLVTKQFVSMVSESTYKLTEKGKRAAKDLSEWDQHAPVIEGTLPSQATHEPARTRFVSRHLVVAAPHILLSGQPTTVYIGFNDADDDNLLLNTAELLICVTAIDGDGKILFKRENIFRLGNRATRQTVEVIGGNFKTLRLRVQVAQPAADEFEIDTSDAPGIYTDIKVTDIAEDSDLRLVAYGADFMIRDE